MPEPTPTTFASNAPALTRAGRYIVLFVAFTAWLCAGFHLAITSLMMPPAALGLLAEAGELDAKKYDQLAKKSPKEGSGVSLRSVMSDEEADQWERWKPLVGQWTGWLTCSMLFGAASGGFIFGRIGDRFGRSKSLALAIITYSSMAAAAGLASSPWELAAFWFLACTGVGGTWPTAVALVSEAWGNWSRPMVAGVIGAAANIGIYGLAQVATLPDWKVTHESWRWMLYFGAAPFVLGVFSWIFVPESPRWLATRLAGNTPASGAGGPAVIQSGIFRPPLLGVTIVGIVLATVPMFGGWGTANWMVPWAEEAGKQMTPPNPSLKAKVLSARSLAGIVGSAIGGWVAGVIGRRLSYFLISLVALSIAQFTFWFRTPTDPDFLYWVYGLGFFSGLYFGWMPLMLPELFPTRVRSTGAGVSFNFGRIITAVTVFSFSALMVRFGGDYAAIGRVTSLSFAFGMIAILFAPDTSKRDLAD